MVVGGAPSRWVVAVAANATVVETRAANELAYFLGRMLATATTTTTATGPGGQPAPAPPPPPLPVVTPAAAKAAGGRQFGVGPAAATALGIDPAQLTEACR